MALTQTEREYEVLIRYHENGKIGAHRVTITEIRDGDILIGSPHPSNPIPIDLATLKSIVFGMTDEDWYVAPVEE